MGIAALGLALILVGALGVFFGRLIKAAVSRQREFLADASAVQYTRNPDSIGGALKKIAVHSRGSGLESPETEEVSHMLFASGFASMSGLLATHPRWRSASAPSSRSSTRSATCRRWPSGSSAAGHGKRPRRSAGVRPNAPLPKASGRA